MPPKRTSTSAALAMTQVAIRQLVANSVATALELLVMLVERKGIMQISAERPPTTMPEKRSYMLRDSPMPQDQRSPGMFLLNQHLARVLFDFGADKSFVSISLASKLNIPPITIDTFYNIETAAEIYFDVVIGMDWLSKYHARIICNEKVVHIPINGETLIIRGTTPVARAPYSLAPSEMLELSNQLTELSDRGFIRPSTSPGDSSFLICDKRKTVFQIVQNLCEAPILALPEGNDDFVVYCDASHQDYDYEICYHPGKANVVADALSQKERIKPLRVISLVMTIHPKLPSQILKAQTEALKEENIKAENLRVMNKAFEIRPDGT
ncbi:reverse transcriptase domain-containing protein [Tanacetum coccineum]